MYQTILVPLDGSARAESILPHVEMLASKIKARVVLLRVAVEEDQITMPVEMRAAVGVNRQPEQPGNTMYAHAHEYLETKQMQLRGNQFEVDIRVQAGPVVQGIIDAAETENADLIAIASHGRTGLSRIFYGSVASGILNRVDRPLLIIRSDDD